MSADQHETKRMPLADLSVVAALSSLPQVAQTRRLDGYSVSQRAQENPDGTNQQIVTFNRFELNKTTTIAVVYDAPPPSPEERLFRHVAITELYPDGTSSNLVVRADGLGLAGENPSTVPLSPQTAQEHLIQLRHALEEKFAAAIISPISESAP